MIQRIQTLFLLGISLLMLLCIFIPFWESDGIEKTTGIAGHVQLDAVMIHFTANGLAALENRGDTYYIAALAFLIGLTALYIVFQYKNRKTQIKLSSFNYLLLSGLIASYFIAIDKAKSIFEAHEISFAVGFYLPLVAIVLNFFALRYIKKDEELIKSVDRIR